jgi:hypothetical protein
LISCNKRINHLSHLIPPGPNLITLGYLIIAFVNLFVFRGIP